MRSKAIIETPRLQLRPCTRQDVDLLHGLWTRPEVRKYLWDDTVIPRQRAASEIEESIRSFKSRGFGGWLMFARAEDCLAGFCSLRQRSLDPDVELLYALAREYWGRGFATEAAQAVLRRAFEHHNLPRVVASADHANQASIRVLERLGMTFQKREFVNGLDLVSYSIDAKSFGIARDIGTRKRETTGV